MTRISGAQRGLNLLLDQIGSQTAVGATGAVKDSGRNSEFDSQLARFDPDASGLTGGGEAGSSASTANSANSEGTGTAQKGTASSVSALFAALTEEGQGTETVPSFPNGTANTSPQPSASASSSSSSSSAAALAAQNPGAASISALLAVLGGEGAGGQASGLTSTATTVATSDDQKQEVTQDQSPSSGSTAFAGASASLGVPAFNNAASLGQISIRSVQYNASSGSSTSNTSSVASKRLTPTGNAGATSKASTSASASKTASQSGNGSVDLGAAAQTTVAMLAGAFMPQNPVATPTSGKAAVSAATSTNVSSLSSAAGAGSLPMPSDDSVDSLTQAAATGTLADSSGSDGTLSQSIKMSVSAVEARTHLVPAQSLSPTQQIADFVALTSGNGGTTGPSASDATAAAATTGSDATSDVTQAPLSMVKTLTLALEPDQLGTVTIKMRLSDSGLEMQVEAEKSETTALIEKDKGNLSDKLQSLGYSVDSLVVKTAAIQGSHLDPSTGQSTAGQGQQAATDASASGLSQNGGRNANDQSPSQGTGDGGGGANQDSTADASSARTVGVYV